MPEMITVEGYRAFHGTMQITPRTDRLQPFELTCDWLFKPETGCWYGHGSSFTENICTVLHDDAQTRKETLRGRG